MNIWKEHITYLTDNPQRYWFKRKLYGFGWIPARLPGWIVLGMYLLVVLGLTLTTPRTLSTQAALVQVVIPICIATIIFLLIAWRTGEPLQWQWGRQQKR